MWAGAVGVALLAGSGGTLALWADAVPQGTGARIETGDLRFAEQWGGVPAVGQDLAWWAVTGTGPERFLPGGPYGVDSGVLPGDTLVARTFVNTVVEGATLRASIIEDQSRREGFTGLAAGGVTVRFGVPQPGHRTARIANNPADLELFAGAALGADRVVPVSSWVPVEIRIQLPSDFEETDGTLWIDLIQLFDPATTFGMGEVR